MSEPELDEGPDEAAPPGVTINDLAVIHGGERNEPEVSASHTRLTLEGDYIPPIVLTYLLPYERRVIAVQRHPIVLAGPAAAFTGALAGAIALNSWAYETGHANLFIVRLIWLTALAAVIWSAIKYAQWRMTWFVATSTRLMLISGLFVRKVEPLPLKRLNDLRVAEAMIGRRYGWGTLTCESFATDHALHTVSYLPYVRDLFNEIWLLRLPAPDALGPKVKRAKNKPG